MTWRGGAAAASCGLSSRDGGLLNFREKAFCTTQRGEWVPGWTLVAPWSVAPVLPMNAESTCESTRRGAPRFKRAMRNGWGKALFNISAWLRTEPPTRQVSRSGKRLS